eukprot:TRINITY_DN63290_c0_g1_i1.p1 TRINITY_DN63290_c0_g1~~TRINITY_DN63290_c0_g1_i1.p1  ORF type:complete len:328 (-),score=35.44 TRINITY_DN63290_c0_g1_i1:54-1037(-)
MNSNSIIIQCHGDIELTVSTTNDQLCIDVTTVNPTIPAIPVRKTANRHAAFVARHPYNVSRGPPAWSSPTKVSPKKKNTTPRKSPPTPRTYPSPTCGIMGRVQPTYSAKAQCARGATTLHLPPTNQQPVIHPQEAEKRTPEPPMPVKPPVTPPASLRHTHVECPLPCQTVREFCWLFGVDCSPWNPKKLVPDWFAHCQEYHQAAPHIKKCLAQAHKLDWREIGIHLVVPTKLRRFIEQEPEEGGMCWGDWSEDMWYGHDELFPKSMGCDILTLDPLRVRQVIDRMVQYCITPVALKEPEFQFLVEKKWESEGHHTPTWRSGEIRSFR